MKALIKVGYGCNENCTFCHTADVRDQNDSAERVEWKIDRAKALGYSMVVFSGGEPTIRPELKRWAARVASHDLDLGLVTNGLVLSYPELADELIEKRRLRYVYMSLHGGTARVHKSVVRADTFDQAMRALDNLEGRVADLTVNCVVTTANVGALDEVVDLLAARRDMTLKFSMTQPKGGGARAFDVIVPEVEACAAAIAAAIRRGQAKTVPGGLRFAHDGVPLCLLPGLEELYDDLKTHDYATMIEADEDDFVPVDDVAKVHPAPCGECALRGPCPGLYRGYEEERGHAMLRPVTDRPRSNSFNFVAERDIARAAGAPCPVRTDGVTPYDAGRTLFLRLRDRMRLFRTKTRDFSDDEVLATKRETAQLYLDQSSKLFPDDFGKDLVKLVRTAECERCPEGGRCAGCYAPSPVDVFGRDDARVLEILGALEGRVLDVGCGDARYFDALRPAIERGTLEYVGIDPNVSRVEALSAKVTHAGARFLALRGEDVTASLGVFDHVLVLRSYNHLRDPSRVLEALAQRLAPGGTLVVVDNVAFGLVRSKPVAARAERSKAGAFEHYRNADAADPVRRLASSALVVEERRDLDRSTSNQWLVRFRAPIAGPNAEEATT
ncbi:MAG TPA: radical SAM protein [Polyangiaceae bacterium]|nr:radical SAM protein [Polyangiaceae bacterium]